MKVLYIETFTRAMKKKGITQGKGELDDYSLTIDLDNLFIVMGKESFELARIPGTKGGYRYFFLCPDCVVGVAGNYLKFTISLPVVLVRKFIKRHSTEVRQIVNTIGD